MSTAFSAAMVKAYKEGLGVDFALPGCGQECSLSGMGRGCIEFRNTGEFHFCFDLKLDSCSPFSAGDHGVPGVLMNLTFALFSQVIMARSPYLEAKVNRWSEGEKKELVIEDCDPTTFNAIVDYMYGIAIPDSVLVNSTANTDEHSSPPSPKKLKKMKLDLMHCIMQNIKKMAKLLEMSDRLLMVDLKDEVEGILIKVVESPIYFSRSPAYQFGVIVQLAEKLSCDKLLAACAKVMGALLRQSADLEVATQGRLTKICTEMVVQSPKFAAKLLLVALTHPDQNA